MKGVSLLNVNAELLKLKAQFQNDVHNIVERIFKPFENEGVTVGFGHQEYSYYLKRKLQYVDCSFNHNGTITVEYRVAFQERPNHSYRLRTVQSLSEQTLCFQEKYQISLEDFLKEMETIQKFLMLDAHTTFPLDLFEERMLGSVA